MFPIAFLLVTVFAVAVFSAPYPPPNCPHSTDEQAANLASSRELNPWQWSDQTEGDMILTPGQRNGLILENYRWRNNEVPYELDPIFNAAEASQIHEAVKVFAAVSCVTVRPRTSQDVDYVYVTGENTGCWSYLGRLGGMQLLNLQRNGCIWNSTIVHEFLHAIGFHHQQSSTERDDYVTIQWENIDYNERKEFKKYESYEITNFGEPYDYLSIMHYDAYAGSCNGRPSMVPRDPQYLELMGRTHRLSQIDVNKLNLMYCQ